MKNKEIDINKVRRGIDYPIKPSVCTFILHTVEDHKWEDCFRKPEEWDHFQAHKMVLFKLYICISSHKEKWIKLVNIFP